jgi:hypothetical protein
LKRNTTENYKKKKKKSEEEDLALRMASWVWSAVSAVAGCAVSAVSAIAGSAAAAVVEKIVDTGFSYEYLFVGYFLKTICLKKMS